MKERHHVIPLSLFWPDIKENIIELNRNDHTILHRNQNIDSNIIRTFRRKVNDILVPNNYFLELKKELWEDYFEWAKTFKEEQKNSIFKQGERLRRPLRIEKINKDSILNINDSIEYLIEMQKACINNILINGNNI
jgi:fido (protein-threonine AMPylation protein)